MPPKLVSIPPPKISSNINNSNNDKPSLPHNIQETKTENLNVANNKETKSTNNNPFGTRKLANINTSDKDKKLNLTNRYANMFN